MKEKMMADMQEALARGDRQAVIRLTQMALADGIDVKTILNDGLIASMSAIGEKFKKNEIFIPEVLIAAKAMHGAIGVLEPQFSACGITPAGRVLIGTVKGDLHDIGKNIVGMMLKGACFTIDDAGIDVAPQHFVDAVKKGGVDIVALSSLLTTSMQSMREVIASLRECGMRNKVKIMVGGAPVTQEFADAIGADAYAKDAASAVDKARELMRMPAA